MSAGAGLVFHGTGFYITDYGKDGKKDQKSSVGRRTASHRTSDADSKSGDSRDSSATPAEAKSDSGSAGPAVADPKSDSGNGAGPSKAPAKAAAPPKASE